MRKPFARLSRQSLYWQAYCALAGPSCEGREPILGDRISVPRFDSKSVPATVRFLDFPTAKVYQSSAKIRQEKCASVCFGESQVGRVSCQGQGLHFVWLLPARPCHNKAKPLRGTCAHSKHTSMHEVFLLQDREASIFWRRGEGGRQHCAILSKTDAYPLQKDTDRRQRGSAGKSPLVPMGSIPEFESLSLRYA